MKIIFYQANFCAECGNAIKPGFSWGPRYFCEECEARMKRQSYFKPLAVMLLCASLAVFALNRTQPSDYANQSSALILTSAISQRAATAEQSLAPKTETAERVLCGARTKKGTPCRHRVLPGQRCAQHRGKPSLLKADETSPAPAKNAPAAR